MVGLLIPLLTWPSHASDQKTELVLSGVFVEACSCAGTCAFETTGGAPGCRNLGGYRIDRGSYGGRDLAGVDIAWAAAPNDRLFVYIDAPDAARQKTGESLARKLFAEGFGKLQAIKAAPIELTGAAGSYRLSVNGGKTLALRTQGVRGGDGRTLVKIDNVFGEPYDALYQGKAVKAMFQEGADTFDLNGSCAFFLPALRVRKAF